MSLSPIIMEIMGVDRPHRTKKKGVVWCEVCGWHQGCFNIMKPKGKRRKRFLWTTIAFISKCGLFVGGNPDATDKCGLQDWKTHFFVMFWTSGTSFLELRRGEIEECQGYWHADETNGRRFQVSVKVKEHWQREVKQKEGIVRSFTLTPGEQTPEKKTLELEE